MSELIRGAQGVLITGSPWCHLFACSPGFEIVPLPPIVKRGQNYRPLEAGPSLEELLEVRSRTIEKILLDYLPDLLIVDNVPCGLRGEMVKALRGLSRAGVTRSVLALRDVLDSPERIHWEWSMAGARAALEQLYDQIWILGDAADARAMSNLPGMNEAAVRVCGRIGIVDGQTQAGREVVDQMEKDGSNQRLRPVSPRLLVSGGGGRDSAPLIDAFVGILKTVRPDVEARIVLGPDFPEAALGDAMAAEKLGARIERFVPDLPAAMADVDVVVAMAGYNTTCEIECLGKRSVLVPRVWPRQEQLIRARRQQRSGRAQVVLPDDLSPTLLWQAIQAALAAPEPVPMPHEGARRAAAYAAELVGHNTETVLEGAVAS